MKSGPFHVRHMELYLVPESVAVTVVEPATAPDVDRFFELLATTVRGEALALIADDIRSYGAPEDRGRQALLDTVGHCATVVAGDLKYQNRKAKPSRSRLLIGSKNRVHTLLVANQPGYPSWIVHESIDMIVDFRPFAHLWQTRLDPKTWLTGEQVTRVEFIWGVGWCLGGLHKQGILCDDAHEGNFVGHKEKTRLVDLGDIRLLYRSPNPQQAAANMLPIMSSLTPVEWRAFQAGYRRRRGDEAASDVFQAVEAQDETGWSAAMEREDFYRALILLDEALIHVDDKDVIRRIQLLANRAQCLSRLGHDTEAVIAYEAVLPLVRKHNPSETSIVQFNLGKAYLRAGNKDGARDCLSAVAESTGPSAELPAIARKMLEHC